MTTVLPFGNRKNFYLQGRTGRSSWNEVWSWHSNQALPTAAYLPGQMLALSLSYSLSGLYYCLPIVMLHFVFLVVWRAKQVHLFEILLFLIVGICLCKLHFRTVFTTLRKFWYVAFPFSVAWRYFLFLFWFSSIYWFLVCVV